MFLGQISDPTSSFRDLLSSSHHLTYIKVMSDCGCFIYCFGLEMNTIMIYCRQASCIMYPFDQHCISTRLKTVLYH